MIDLRNCDNMDLMKSFPDKYFDLAIVDPPYGWGDLKGRNINGNASEWNVAPSEYYFNELFRVSKNQIIWGGNYFKLPPHKHFIIWDKKQPLKQFARCEFAWSSFDKNAQVFEYAYYGNLNTNKNRFHPTEKPIQLYNYLLKEFANKGDKILDTHLGSGSIAIACHYAELDLVGCEINEVYFKKLMKRFHQLTIQQKMF